MGKHCPPISAVRVGNKLPTLLGLISNGRTTRTFSIATRNAVRTSGNTSTRCRRSVTTVKKYVPPATLARRYRAMTIIRKTNGFMVARVSRRRNPWNQRGQIRRQAARVSRQRNPQNQRFNLAPNRGLMKPTRPTGLTPGALPTNKRFAWATCCPPWLVTRWYLPAEYPWIIDRNIG